MIQRVEKLSPLWAKVSRGSQRALLATETATLAKLRGSIQRADDALSRAIDAGDSEATKLRALRAIRDVATRLRTETAGVVAAGRDAARVAALLRLTQELKAVALDLRVDELETPDQSDGAEDAGLGDSAGEAIASGWRLHTSAAVLAWADDPTTDLGRALRPAGAAQDAKLRRIAATENARAYNDEHAEALDTLADEHADRLWLPLLVRRWDAEMDRRTCRVCERMDGRYTALGLNFAGGIEPGFAHLSCRCMDSLIVLPIGLRDELDEDEPDDSGEEEQEAA